MYFCVIIHIMYCNYSTWWLIPLSKWVITPVINGIFVGLIHWNHWGYNPLTIRGMRHQVPPFSDTSGFPGWRPWRSKNCAASDLDLPWVSSLLSFLVVGHSDLLDAHILSNIYIYTHRYTYTYTQICKYTIIYPSYTEIMHIYIFFMAGRVCYPAINFVVRICPASEELDFNWLLLIWK